MISDKATTTVVTEDIPVDEAILQAGDHHGSTFFQHQKFLQLVRGGKGRPEVSLEDGLWSVRVGEVAELSAKSRKAINLDEI